MSEALRRGEDDGVELLERSLGYTRRALGDVRPAHLQRRTPCAGWSLDQLLCHMDDALDAFIEGASGAVDVAPRGPLDVRLGALQVKACALLGAWSAPGAPRLVRVGGLPVPTHVVARAAALEIAVHGWDVAQTTGAATPIPDDLARLLRPVAQALVADADRGTRFADPLDAAPDAPHDVRLLAHLGRRPGAHLTGPPRQVSAIPRTERRPAS